jgi:HEAT repeat protein
MALDSTQAAVLQLLNDIETFRRSLRLYADTHPALGPAQERIRLSVQRLGELCSLGTLALSPDQVSWNQVEVPVAPTAPAARLVQLLFHLGVAALHIELARAADSLTLLTKLLGQAHEPPGESDRAALFAAQPNLLPGVELVPIDLSAVQLVAAGEQSSEDGSRIVLRELAERLAHEGAFDLAGRLHSGELTPGVVIEMLAATEGSESLFDHLFRQLGAIVQSTPSVRRRVVHTEIREFLAELLRLLDPDYRHMAVAFAFRHLPMAPNTADPADRLLGNDLLLDIVELLISRRLAIPDGILRAIQQVAEQPSNPDDPSAGADGARARGLLARFSEVAAPSTAPPASPAQVLATDWRGQLCVRELLDALTETALRGHLVHVLKESVSQWPDETVSASAAVRLAEELVTAIDIGDLQTALDLAPTLAGTHSPEARRLGFETGVRAITRAFRSLDRTVHPTLAAILTALGELALPVILEAVAEEESLAVRKRLLEVVARQHEKAIPYLRPMIDDPRWYVVRNAIFLLRKLGDRASLPQIEARLAGARPQVLGEVLKTLVAFEDPSWLATLVNYLDSQNEELRRVALTVAARIHSPQVAQALIERLRQSLAKSMRDPFTVELIGALGRLRTPAALPILREVTELKQWRTSFSITPLRRAAAVAIAGLDTLEARELTLALADDHDRAVAAAVHAAAASVARPEEEDE